MDLIFSFLGQMFIYGLVAVFLENSLLSRGHGQLHGSVADAGPPPAAAFRGRVLTVTILLSSIGAYFITPWVNQSVVQL